MSDPPSLSDPSSATDPAPLVDRNALRRNRTRATRDDMPLQRLALDDVQDRLQMVNKSFPDTALVTPFPEVWAPAFPAARCVADDDTLALMPQSCDLVIHAMCLHWANDPVGQLIQCRRALRPDGLLLAVLPGGETLATLRQTLIRAEADVTGGLSPRFLPMADIRDLGALLQRAGLALPVADSMDYTFEYKDLIHLMHDLRAMGEANALTARPRLATRRAVFARADALYPRASGAPQGTLAATFQVITLTGWAPAADQPRPLRPGSATTRLADALRTEETKLQE